MTPDLRLEDHGTVVVIDPLTPVGRAWVEQNCQTEPWQWLGGSLVIDWRYADAIAVGAVEDGLVVKAGAPVTH